jgi:hypothetical protein
LRNKYLTDLPVILSTGTNELAVTPTVACDLRVDLSRDNVETELDRYQVSLMRT